MAEYIGTEREKLLKPAGRPPPLPISVSDVNYENPMASASEPALVNSGSTVTLQYEAEDEEGSQSGEESEPFIKVDESLEVHNIT